MESNKLIIVKLAIGLLCLACFLCLKRTVQKETGHTRFFLPGALAMWLVSRLGLFVALYGILGYAVPSDVPAYYYEPAKMALDGKIAYRDFHSSYGPIFPFIAAGAVKVWDSPKAIVLLAILFEGLAILLWSRVANRTLSAHTKLGLLLYLCNPLPILNIAVAGQNQIWLSCFLAAAFGLFLAKREFFSGFLIGVSVLAVKVLGLMFVPYWWLNSKSKIRFTSGLILALAIGFFPFYWVGADILQPLKLEGAMMTSGNLPYLLSMFGFNPAGQTTGVLLNLILLASVGGMGLLLYILDQRRAKSGMSLLGLSAILLVFMLLSKKSYSNYLNLAMLSLCFSASEVLCRRWQQVLFILWCSVAALKPSLWHRWLAKSYMNESLQNQLGCFKLSIFILVELILIGGYLAQLWLIMRHIIKPENSGKSIVKLGVAPA